MGTVPRIGLRRTQAVDDLLNEIWELRPELKRKNTTTILLGLEAFLRECKVQALAAQVQPFRVAPAVKQQANVVMQSHISEASKDSSVSDDVEW